jgi:hypothetical protein
VTGFGESHSQKLQFVKFFFEPKKRGDQKMTTSKIAICHGQSIHVSWDMKLFVAPKV